MPFRARIAIPGGATVVVTLDRPPYTLGRAPENTLVIPHPTVSSRHGEIVALGDGGLAFVDRGSRNGTRLNGTPLQPHVPARLTAGDNLQIGSVVIMFESEGAAREARLQLEVRSPTVVERRVDVTSFPFRVGRSADNDLPLASAVVSSHHGELRDVGGTVVYVDLGSRNGSRINGAPVAPGVETRLRDGDTIRVGDTDLRARFAARERDGEPPPTVPRQVLQEGMAAPREAEAPARPLPAPPRRGAGRAVAAATATVLGLCLCACVAGGVAMLALTTSWPPVGGGRGGTGRDGMAQVRIPAGPFLMGSDAGEPDEAPAHTVDLPAFWIDRTKITVEMFRRWAATNRVEGPWSRDADPKSPVVGVTYADAENYCKAQGRRLPTEAEWEKAARGDDGRVYPWGNNWDPNRVDFGSFRFSAYPVATLGKVWGPAGAVREGASVYGVLDVAGGPREWVADWYGPYPGAQPLGFEVPKERFRVTRGGFRINNYSRDVRATARGWQHPSEASLDLGFRCAQ
jgi:formylglycine-generating enzyme required for sulfatase activity/pSer/pThr/pTyr-binding forkhead associated (FHA) protein